MDKKTKEIVEILKGPMETLKKINEQNLVDVKDQIDDIISMEFKDENIIEHTFDRLLDLAHWYGIDIKDIYYKFLDYYKKTNKEASDDYKEFYLEILMEMDEPLDENDKQFYLKRK